MTTEMFASAGVPSSASRRRRNRFPLRSIVATTAVIAFVGGMGATASADAGDTSGGPTTATIGVSSAITLSSLTPGFRLNGIPGDVISGEQVVTYNVQTNNIAGYTVTVTSASANLVSSSPLTNADLIPIADLSVRQHAANDTVGTAAGAGWLALSTGALSVHTQGTRSAPGGDNISNDYRIAIPFVSDDTYSTTLNYLATAL